MTNTQYLQKSKQQQKRNIICNCDNKVKNPAAGYVRCSTVRYSTVQQESLGVSVAVAVIGSNVADPI